MTVSECKTILLLVAALFASLTVSAQSFYEREPSRYDVEMHFDIDSVGPPGSRGVALRLPGTLNGRRATFTLDTGASTSVVSPQLLDRYGLRLLDDSVSVEGMDTVTVQRAIADSLTLGLLTTDDLEQAQDRSGGRLGNKGDECAIDAIKMAKF